MHLSFELFFFTTAVLNQIRFMLKPFDTSVKFGFQKFSKQSAKQNKSQNNEKVIKNLSLTFLTFARRDFILQSVLKFTRPMHVRMS